MGVLTDREIDLVPSVAPVEATLVVPTTNLEFTTGVCSTQHRARVGYWEQAQHRRVYGNCLNSLTLIRDPIQLAIRSNFTGCQFTVKMAEKCRSGGVPSDGDPMKLPLRLMSWPRTTACQLTARTAFTQVHQAGRRTDAVTLCIRWKSAPRPRIS